MRDRARLRRLTQITYGRGTHEHPVFSPDGSRLAWYAGDFGWIQIVVGNADGSGMRAVTSDVGNHTQPAWSPDGRHLWYRAQPTNEAPWALWRVAVDDPDDRTCVLSHRRASMKHPSPSPDGRTLAWFSDEGSPDNFHVWTAPLHASSRGVRLGPRERITDSTERNDCHPTWSPDGRRIAFHAYMGVVDASDSHVFVCDERGGELRQLTQGEGLHKHPYFVGSALIVHHVEGVKKRWLELRRVADGSLVERLTSGKHRDKHPSPWVPERGPVRICFASKNRGVIIPQKPEPRYHVFWGTLEGVRVPR
jgi:TolB protein